jgi:hypothetical protein
MFHIHCSIIHNSQNIETPQVSIGRRMNKEIVVYIHNEILFEFKKEDSTIWAYIDETEGRYAK